MRHLLSLVLDRAPYIGKLRRQLRNEREMQGFYPSGHYYSPVPHAADVREYCFTAKPPALSGIDLNKEYQLQLLTYYQEYYADLPFPEEPTAGMRYYYNQSVFCYADAIFLYCFLRKHQPARIVEVGSGFSTAVTLDTAERHLPGLQLTCIEPYPERLRRLLKSQDVIRLVESPVQSLPLETFGSLGPGDLLFIDSTHVVKCGSDVQYLLFEVLPQLPPGVFVHFHDVFYPFEYPKEWLLAGRYWNEDYFLRAFLSYNSQWGIHFFNHYVALEFADVLAASMPLCLKNTGGSLYIQKLAAK